MKIPNLFSAIPTPWKIGAGVALLVALFLAFKACVATTNHKTDAAIDAAEGKGAATAAATAATKGLDNVEQANKAAAVVARDPVAQHRGCVRHSRTPENC